MRRWLILSLSALAILIVVALVTRAEDNPCDVVAERDLFDSISDVNDRGDEPTLEAAVEAAFARADMPREVEASDLAPVVRGSGNVIHVGIGGYWLMLASVEDGYVAVSVPKQCSVLDAAPSP
jgi:hypothetical protein